MSREPRGKKSKKRLYAAEMQQQLLRLRQRVHKMLHGQVVRVPDEDFRDLPVDTFSFLQPSAM